MGLQYLIPFSVKTSNFVNVSAPCKKSIGIFVKSYERGEQWAVRMADSSGKIPSGLLSGSTWFSGDMSQCLRVKSPVEYILSASMDSLSYEGQYCYWNIRNVKEIRLRNIELIYTFDICIPSLCKTEDLRLFLNGYSIYPFQVHCDYDKTHINIAQWICIGVFVFILLIVIISTVTDISLILTKNDSKVKYILLQHLLSFSAYSNIQHLFKTEQHNYLCLQGIRVLCALWIIMVHVPTFSLIYFKNQRYLSPFWSELDNRFFTLSVSTGHFGVCTFFFLSALLTTNSRFLRQNKLLHYMKFVIYRYFRLIPAMMSTVAIIIILPLWVKNSVYATANNENCLKTWWKNLLYVNNFFLNERCAGHTWFLSCLMQFTVITVFIGIIFKKYHKLWLSFIGVLILTGILEKLVLNLSYESGKMFSTINNGTFISYYTPDTYLTAYFGGIAFGYFLPKIKNMKLSQMKVLIAWCISFCFLSLAVYGNYGYDNIHRPSKLVYTSYNALFQITWIIGISLLIFLCLTGNGGRINAFLSARLFTIFDRLSFQMYLLHPFVILYYYGSIKSPIYFDSHEMVFLFLSITTVTTLISIIFYVCIDEPVSFALYLLFPRDTNRLKEKAVTDTIHQIENDCEVNQHENGTREMATYSESNDENMKNEDQKHSF